MQQDLRKTVFIRIELTDEQPDRPKEEMRRDDQPVEVTAEELEQRIVPAMGWNHNDTLVAEGLEDRIAPGMNLGNHNETMLDD